jgi:hypothetical protein
MAGFVFLTILVLSMIFLLLPRTILLVKEGMDGRERSAIAIGEESTVEMAYKHSMYGVRQNEISGPLPQRFIMMRIRHPAWRFKAVSGSSKGKGKSTPF